MKAIGYARRSSDRQDESLQQQREQLAAFAKRQGWSLVAVYSDDAISGSELSRPGLEQLLKAATKPDIDVVLTWDRNRLARPKDAIDGMLLERRLRESGIRIVYASNGQEADCSFTSGLLSYVEHHQNGDYLRKLSRDTMRGLVDRAKRGRWPGGPVPFGYDRLILDGDTPKRIVRSTSDGGQLVLDAESHAVLDTLPKGKSHKKQDHESCVLIPSEPERVRAVRRLFQGFADGKPTRRLREELNDSGFRTSRGSRFTVQTLLPMLENRAYLGECVYNRRTHSKWHRYVEGTSEERADDGLEHRPQEDWVVCAEAWEALVDTETFEAVQRRRAQSKKRGTHFRGNNMRSNYLLTGIAFCSVCGGRLTGTTQTSGKGYKTRYYVCSRHSAGHSDECPKRYTVPASVIEDHIVGLIRDDVQRFRDDESFFDLVVEKYQRLRDSRDDGARQVEKRMAEVVRELDGVRDHILAMEPATARSAGLYERADALAEEKRVCDSALRSVNGSSTSPPDEAEIRDLALKQFDRLDEVIGAGTTEEMRALLAEYVHRVEAFPEEQSVRIGLYPPGLRQMVAGAGFEPATFGL